MPRKLIRNYTDKGTLPYIPDYLPCGPFIDPFEIEDESPNAAIKMVAKAKRTFRNVTEKEFRRHLPEIMDIVCKHFGIPRKKRKKCDYLFFNDGRMLLKT